MSGTVPHPYVITAAATNKPWDLDFALLRRFELKFYIQLPKPRERYGIMRNIIFAATSKTLNEHPRLDLNSTEIIKLAEGLTGSDLLTAILNAVERVTLITFEGVTLSDDEYKLQRKEIEETKTPIRFTAGFLNQEILIKGIKGVPPSYNFDELERLNDFARYAILERKQQEIPVLRSEPFKFTLLLYPMLTI